MESFRDCNRLLLPELHFPSFSIVRKSLFRKYFVCVWIRFQRVYNNPSAASTRASVFLSLLFHDLILREYVSLLQGKTISQVSIDLTVRWISYSAESNNVPQIPSGFRESPSFPSISTYRNLDYPVYCCFAVALFFLFPVSLFLSLSFSIFIFCFLFVSYVITIATKLLFFCKCLQTLRNILVTYCTVRHQRSNGKLQSFE